MIGFVEVPVIVVFVPAVSETTPLLVMVEPLTAMPEPAVRDVMPVLFTTMSPDVLLTDIPVPAVSEVTPVFLITTFPVVGLTNRPDPPTVREETPDATPDTFTTGYWDEPVMLTFVPPSTATTEPFVRSEIWACKLFISLLT